MRPGVAEEHEEPPLVPEGPPEVRAVEACARRLEAGARTGDRRQQLRRAHDLCRQRDAAKEDERQGEWRTGAPTWVHCGPPLSRASASPKAVCAMPAMVRPMLS